jgi:hypothetical protein
MADRYAGDRRKRPRTPRRQPPDRSSDKLPVAPPGTPPDKPPGPPDKPPVARRGKPPVATPLWACPACGRSFANRNQSHFCGRYDLEAHFSGKSETARRLFDDFVSLVQGVGPVVVLAEKSRIAFQVRMSFAALMVRKHHLVGHLVLARRVEHPRFTCIDTISPRNHVHHFRLERREDFDPLFLSWVREAYAVGEQKHLPRATSGRRGRGRRQGR